MSAAARRAAAGASATPAAYRGPERRSGKDRRTGTERRGQAECSAAHPHAAAYRGSDGHMHVHGWYADFSEAKRQAGILKALHGSAGVFSAEFPGEGDGDA